MPYLTSVDREGLLPDCWRDNGGPTGPCQFPTAYAADNNINTFAHTAFGSPSFIQLELAGSAPAPVDSVRLVGRADGAVYSQDSALWVSTGASYASTGQQCNAAPIILQGVAASVLVSCSAVQLVGPPRFVTVPRASAVQAQVLAEVTVYRRACFSAPPAGYAFSCERANLPFVTNHGTPYGLFPGCALAANGNTCSNPSSYVADGLTSTFAATANATSPYMQVWRVNASEHPDCQQAGHLEAFWVHVWWPHGEPHGLLLRCSHLHWGNDAELAQWHHR